MGGGLPSYLLTLTLLPDPDVRNSFAPNASCPMQFVWQCRLSSRSYKSESQASQKRKQSDEDGDGDGDGRLQDANVK